MRRTAGRGNPVSNLIATYFGIPFTDIGAVATAEASPADAMTCVKPFTIPDRWRETQTAIGTEDDTFDLLDKKGSRSATRTSTGPGDQHGLHRLRPANRDVGMLITLKASNDDKIAPSFYYRWRMARRSNTGGDEYRWNIANCNDDIYGAGATSTMPEPGNMVGPTKQGMEDLIALDPDAYWGTDNKVHSTKNPSPRVIAIPLYRSRLLRGGQARTAATRASGS